MYSFKEKFPRYDATEDGKVLRDGELLRPFKSNKYLQVVLFDADGMSHTLGVHTVVAMKYLDYYDGCIVHHRDNDGHNNHVSNLEVMSRSQHSREHGKYNRTLADYVQLHGPVNKGKKMTPEFCKKCSESAKRRHSKRNS